MRLLAKRHIMRHDLLLKIKVDLFFCPIHINIVQNLLLHQTIF
jgi:hypothetical protein